MSSQLPPADVDKRRRRPRGESATEFLRDFPALLALSRLAVPILAVEDNGEIEFANEAFAAMIGHSRQDLVSMTAQSLVTCIPPLNSGVARVRRFGHRVTTRRRLDRARTDQRFGADPRK